MGRAATAACTLLALACSVDDPALVDPTVDVSMREAEVADTTGSRTWNAPPQAHPRQPGRIMLDSGHELVVDLDTLFYDPDGDPLTYSLASYDTREAYRAAYWPTGGIRFDGSVFRFTPSSDQLALIWVTVSDGTHDVWFLLRPVQVGCPGRSMVPSHTAQTGKISIYRAENAPKFDNCTRLMMSGAAAFLDAVIADDEYRVFVQLETLPDTTRLPIAATGTQDARNPVTKTVTGRLAVPSRFAEFNEPLAAYNILRHELIHVLGLGDSRAWIDLLDLSDDGDPRFMGERARDVFHQHDHENLWDARERGVPVAPRDPTLAVHGAFSHWRSQAVAGDAMSYCSLFTVGIEPVTPLTLAALSDLGWTVDFTMAEDGLRIGKWNC